MEQMLDTELVDLARRGESRAFDVLIQRYQTKVTHLVYRYVDDRDTALDLVQDIFLKIFRNLVGFKGESKFSSWMFRIAVNDCIDHRRRLKVRKEQSLDRIQEFGFDVVDEHEETNIEGRILAAETKRELKAALEDLPAKQKAVVVMKIYQDMTFDEISEIVGDPVSTVKSRLYKALKSMGSELRRKSFLEGGKV